MSAYPPFPGTEANFLRAQLARIAAGTVLCPAGYFTANEEGGLDKAEDFTPPAPTDLGTTAAWAHRYPHLKKQGTAATVAEDSNASHFMRVEVWDACLVMHLIA